MSITDELREYAKKAVKRPDYMGGMTFDLMRIADRIDVEHEAKVSYWQGASYKDGYDEGFASADDWLADHEGAMAEHGWVKLPVDADGVPIRIGDALGGYGKTIEIVELRNDGTWHLVDEFGIEWHDHEAFAHVQPDSWERIIRDAQGDGILNQIDGRPSDFDALVERCKRLAGEGA